jgi:signal transduction histidine kinase
MRTAAELRAAAGAEADRLRRALGDLAGGRPRPLADTLAEVAGEFGRLGLRTEVLAAGDLPELSPRRAAAVRDAARAALGNVVKHAGVGRAVLRADSVDGGLRLVVRDHGVGFDPSRTLPGFGLGQSVVARLGEVGGRAGVTSSPGAGTRVLLWVPR